MKRIVPVLLLTVSLPGLAWADGDPSETVTVTNIPAVSKASDRKPADMPPEALAPSFDEPADEMDDAAFADEADAPDDAGIAPPPVKQKKVVKIDAANLPYGPDKNRSEPAPAAPKSKKSSAAPAPKNEKETEAHPPQSDKAAPVTLTIDTHVSPAPAPVPGTTPAGDRRMKILPYNEADVYTITTRYGYQTNIVFGSGEAIQTISVGDRSLWQIIPSGNRLFIRPMDEGVTTNMTVLTNQHSYQFDLKSVDDDSTGIIYVAKFSYPDETGQKSGMLPLYNAQGGLINAQGQPLAPAPGMMPPPGAMPPAMPQPGLATPAPVMPVQRTMPPPPVGMPVAPAPMQAPITAPPVQPPVVQNLAKPPVTPPAAMPAPPVQHTLSAPAPTPAAPQNMAKPPAATPAPKNYKYSFSGPDNLSPLQAYDDGKLTYVKLRSTTPPLPTPFYIDANGKEQLAPYSLQGDTMVFPGLGKELIFRDPKGEVHIYNDTLNPE